ncbi:hypothetical protein [Burkholderia phage FLC9]|nr:hypothetical protein [Burkholderia phage FLC9]
MNLAVAAYQTPYNGNTIYAQYTGNIGQPQTYGTSNTFTVAADGFLMNNAGSTGNAGGIFVPTTLVQDWSVATQYWLGFRTKLLSNTGSSCHLVVATNNTSFSSWVTLLDESHLIAAGLQQIGYEVFIEIFLDRTAMTFQTYGNGLLINSGTVNTNTFSLSSLLMFGQFVTGAANASRGYRDFYFLDVDASTPGRLGPIRARAATNTAVSGSEWTPNGAADIATALGTALQNPPLSTPNAQSPADNQPLTISLGTTVSDSGQKILAVQPTLSYAGANGNVAKMNAVIQDASNNNQALGQFVNGGGLLINQKLPSQTKAPDGTAWTAAKINQAKYVLTPTT